MVLIELLESRSMFSAALAGLAVPTASPALPSVVATHADSTPLTAELNTAWTFVRAQLSKTLAASPLTSSFPSYTNADGSWHMVRTPDWTSGFFAGELWQAYAHFGGKTLKKNALRLTAELTAQTVAKDDLAFRFLTTDGLQNKFTTDGVSAKALIAAASSKISAFDSTVGMFRSVDSRASTSGNPKANFPVLMDHTMDIELVYRAAALAKRSDWIRKANAHLAKEETTMIRPDGSTYQWGYFNQKTGKFIDGETRQGYSNSSTWSRGQAWAMYSFTAAAELRGRADFLATAKKTADYFVNHLPADGVPYWDFNAPVTSKTPRDSSAAAIGASALLRLAHLIPGTTDAPRYEAAAEKILATLASPVYFAQGAKSSGILLHGVRWVAKGATDESLVFGDYYFLEAMNRYAGVI